MEKYEGTIPELKFKDGENKFIIFVSKNVRLNPKLQGRILCSHFYSKVYYFLNYKNKRTHVPSTGLDNVSNVNYGKYVRTCRYE